MVRWRLLPQDTRFFDQFEQSVATMRRAAAALADLLAHPDQVPTKLQHIKDLEHEADRVMYEVMDTLNETFITPFDREDISALIRSLDDITDGIWAVASRLDVFSIEAATPTAQALAQTLIQQAEELAQALPLLRRRKDMRGILAHTTEINRLENAADDLLREGLRDLFPQPLDPDGIVLAIKWREIYDYLEIATDRAKEAASIINGIVLKHA